MAGRDGLRDPTRKNYSRMEPETGSVTPPDSGTGKRVQLIHADKLEALTGLTDRRHRQLAKDGWFPPPKMSQYEMVPTLQGLFRYYREQGDKETPKAKLTAAQEEGQMLRNRLREMEVKEASGQLMSRDALDELYRVTAEPLKQALDSMPDALAMRVNPGDPSHATEVLRNWSNGLRRQIASSLEVFA